MAEQQDEMLAILREGRDIQRDHLVWAKEETEQARQLRERSIKNQNVKLLINLPAVVLIVLGVIEIMSAG